jgi:hypothetical protein
MKKLLVLATAALFVSGLCLGNNGDGDKGKKKPKKSGMHTCPGKECSKAKG